MDRCPICRARRRDNLVCQRCGSDLNLLVRIEAQALAWQRLAIAKLLANQPQQAQQALQQALQLKRLPLALALSEFLQTDLCQLTDEPTESLKSCFKNSFDFGVRMHRTESKIDKILFSGENENL